MNLPNKLTIGRMCAIPIIISVSLIKPLQGIAIGNNFITLEMLILLIIFIIASFTDFLDGYLARKNNMVTNFGKFMDPLADKLLVMSTLVVLLERGLLTSFGVSLGFAVTIILAREFAVTGIRLVAASNNLVIAASKLGKAKTVSQMIMIIIILLGCFPFSLLGETSKDIATVVFVSIATLLTLISGIDYFIKNAFVLKENKKGE